MNLTDEKNLLLLKEMGGQKIFEHKGGSRERGGVWQVIVSKLNWHKDVWWLDVQRSEGQVYPTCKDRFSFLGNRARYEFIKLDMSTDLDEQINLRNQARYGFIEIDIVNWQ